MTAYISFDDYETYGGEPVNEDDFERYAIRASMLVDAQCGGKVESAGFNSFDNITKQRIQMATCAQCNALVQNGIDAADGSPESFTVGAVSISGGTVGNSTAGVMLCPTAWTLLVPTGLLYAGVVMC